MFHIREIDGAGVKVDVEQHPVAQAALVAIDNVSGEDKDNGGRVQFRRFEI